MTSCHKAEGSVCGWLIKHYGCPVDCYFATISPISLPLSLLSFLPPPPFFFFFHSRCDITGWLRRTEKLLALEIDVAVCPWLRSHSHGRHTSSLVHARPHISAPVHHARFGLHSDAGAGSCGLRECELLWRFCPSTACSHLRRLVTHPPIWGWKEWLQVCVSADIYYHHIMSSLMA